MPRYRVPEQEVDRRLSRRKFYCASALLGTRRIARSTDERSCIASLIPWGAASDGYIISAGPSACELTYLAAAYNSFIYDYLLRNSFSQASVPQSTSEQIPVPAPAEFTKSRAFTEGQTLGVWTMRRVHELTFTAWDMGAFAKDLGDEGPPFQWNEDRRSSIRAELDAAFFHIYGLPRDEVEHVMDSFDALQRREEKQLGECRTGKATDLGSVRRYGAGCSNRDPSIRPCLIRRRDKVHVMEASDDRRRRPGEGKQRGSRFGRLWMCSGTRPSR